MIIPSKYHLSDIGSLNKPLTTLKGIGSKRAECLSRKGLNRVLDLLLFMPIRYEDRTRLAPISVLKPNDVSWIRGEVVSAREKRPLIKGRGLFSITIREDSAELELVWFHYRKPHLQGFSEKGTSLMAFGQVTENKGKVQMVHPHVVKAEKNVKKRLLEYFPVYRNVEGVPRQVVRTAILEAIDDFEDIIEDALPVELVKRNNLPTLKKAVKGIHLPPTSLAIEDLTRFKTGYHRRLLFDRFFHFMANMALRKRDRTVRKGPAFLIPPGFTDRFQRLLSFTLTGGQFQTIKEIATDLTKEAPMNRMVQGDVGCGKTVVAVASVYAAVLNNYQAAVMAPTQILAQQHFEYFRDMPSELGLRPVLLTGTLNSRERHELYGKIAQGDFNLIIGTQALLQEGLSFHSLGLVVIDEQQRFGVRQRGVLRAKGDIPHTLVMTATPIPRSLAMIVYGDTDISIIREHPEGRETVATHIVKDEKRGAIYDGMKKRMAAGEQCLVICPVIERTEDEDLKNAKDMFINLRKIFYPKFRLDLIHGQISSAEKERIMEEFRKGDIDLLVGTTVVEVGVHAPGATILVVEHPERFGLAQLHQLRGRVGRGSKKGLSIFMLPENIGEAAMQRLKILAETSDGFEIAKKDLELRGQGELMGLRQAGAGEIDLMEIMEEPELLMEAKRAAEEIIESDPELRDPGHRYIKKIVGFQ